MPDSDSTRDTAPDYLSGMGFNANDIPEADLDELEGLRKLAGVMEAIVERYEE